MLTVNAAAITADCNCWSCVNFVPDALDALEFVDDETGRLQRSVRRATPTPAPSVSDGLTLLRQAARRALRRPFGEVTHGAR